jgi:alcohol dehydrogenase (cytochrome c)
MGPTQRELSAADASRGDWLYGTHDYSGRRYTVLDRLTPANVASLRPVCVYQAGSLGAFHTNPLVHRGVMYLTTRHATIALDAKTCAVKWRHAWDPSQRAMAQANRGVAIKDGRVVRGTADGRLIALDAATGDVLWERKAADRARGEMFNMAPVIFEDLVIIGPAGSELGFRGWIGAFKLSDGSPVWRFNTVPMPGEPGAETWPTETAAERGGGAVWTPLALDAETGIVFVPTTNPAPDFAGDVRAGANLYTNSVVALDARTGALVWARQLIPHDTHDWDVTQAGPLFSARIGGVERTLVAGAAKDGMLHALDRKSGAIVWSTAVSKRENVDVPLTPQGVHVCPGILGGVQWNGAAFSPRSGLLYIPSVDWCATFTVDKDEPPYVAGAGYMGGSFTLDPVASGRGWLSAVDAATGKIRWRYASKAPMLGAVTATASGLLLTGETSGDFLALDATSGRVLYRFATGGAVAGGVITYAVDGSQYVAVMSGGLTSFWGKPDGAATVIVFGLR